ncbi:MAG: hypothetical protein AB7V46_17935, partial [Thermomicrobiales bacterium]
VNTPPNDRGIGGAPGSLGGGNEIGINEGMRVDFVYDLTGTPASGGTGYQNVANRNHVFDDHYTVNGASAKFVSTGGTSYVRIAAFVDSDAGGNDVVGDDVSAPILSIVIKHIGGTVAIGDDVSAPITGSGTYIVDGHSYTVTFSGGEVTVGPLIDNTEIATFTALPGFNAIEYYYDSGDPFAIGDFGAEATSTTAPVTFDIPISIMDSDGDTVPSGAITITADPDEPLPAPPIVLDLDGDGVEFTGLDAGVLYDYNGDGLLEATAWTGADDGILAYDANHDGTVSNASEFVFGGAGLTDLEALAAYYDSNGDGVLDAQDATFAQFGVWQDADQDGIADDGEFRLLTDLGITEISLTSDGIDYIAEDGEVLVAGSGYYSRDDGTTASFADAIFSTRQTEQTVMAAAAAALLVATTEETTAFIPETGDGDEVQVTVLAETDAPSLLIQNMEDDGGTGLATLLSDDSDDVAATAPESVAETSQDLDPIPVPTDDVASYDDAMSTAGQTDDSDGLGLLADAGSDIGSAMDDGAALMESLLVLAAAESAKQSQDPAPVDTAAAKDAVTEIAEQSVVDHLLDGLLGSSASLAEVPVVDANHASLASLLDQGVGDSIFQFSAMDTGTSDEDLSALAAAQV